jgi:dienelactone hydrolase
MRRSLVATAALAAAATAGLSGPAMAEPVAYEVDGQSFHGYFAGAEQPKGLVLIVHDWDGVDEYEHRRADMLAELGYDAFVLDMFGDGTPAGTVEERRAATGALYSDRKRMRALIQAGLGQAREQSGAERVVVTGYCFGGAVALEMARAPELSSEAAGYASFHGGLETPEGQSWPEGVPPILIMHGGADTSVTLEDVTTLAQELEAAAAPYTIEIYSNAPHAFTVFGSDRFQERADAESWEAFTDFLAEQLG